MNNHKQTLTIIIGTFIIVLISFGLLGCVNGGSPSQLGQQDAIEMNNALRSNDIRKIEKAERHRNEHLQKYNNNSDAAFEYMDAYRDALD